MKAKKIIEKIFFPYHKKNGEKLKKIISGKTILITGASYGIGECIVNNLAFENTTLILTARSEEKLQMIKQQLQSKGANVYIFAADLYDTKQVDLLLQFIKNKELEIDIFIHNAGKSICRSIFDSLERYHDFTRTIEINYLAAVKIILTILPDLKKKKGHIISISAINVLSPPTPYWAAYQASKTALDSWLKSIEIELNENNIDISTIYLPLVRTRMIEPNERYKNSSTMKPEQAANIVCQRMIDRKRKWKPWWALSSQIFLKIFAYPFKIITLHYFK